MGATIDRDAVCVGREKSFTNFYHIAITLIKNRDDATLGRDIESAQSGIKRENVRIRADG